MHADDDKFWSWFQNGLSSRGRGQRIISLILKTDVSITRGQQRYTVGKTVSSFFAPKTEQTKDLIELIPHFSIVSCCSEGT